MSAENVDLVRRLQPGPDVDLAEQGGEPGVVGSVERTGLTGLREVWLEWLQPWASYRSEIEQLMDLGDRVLVLVRDFGRHRDGGPEVRLVSGAIWTVREGSVSRIEFYTSRESALQAAGLTN